MNWKVRKKSIPFDKPLLMGVINLTPDSFSDGGKYNQTENALARAAEMEAGGAAILDLGAESSRPGAPEISIEEELQRILPVLKALRKKTDLLISIDTVKAAVAKACLDEGADIINDISGLKSDAAMAALAAEYEAGLILMHRRGNAATMQQLASYADVVDDILRELRESIVLATDAGVSREAIMIDPGLGFAKQPEHNLEILSRIDEFQSLGFPLLLGPSRKSFIGAVTGRDVDQREFGTAAVVAYAVMHGVSVVRVHETDKMRDVVEMISAIQGVKHVRTF